MEALFWISAGLVVYVYVGYPALLCVWVRVRGGRVADPQHSARRRARMVPRVDRLPGVSIVIAARNEAARLPARIENLLACDYPSDRLQIVVASDGSTDGTAEALAPYRDRIELLVLPASGKAAALNAAVARARYPILVFADARQRFAPDAIRRLVCRFANPTVGAVSGELVLDCESGASGTVSSIGDGVGAYWRYEKWLRRHEACVGSTLGVTGAVYAMRRWLWQPLPADTLLDDVLGPMRIVLRGYTVTFEPGAIAFDVASRDASAELRRKVRTLAGNYQLLAQEPRLLLPLVNPVWLQFVSHKIGRLLVPYALVGLFAASAVLATTSWLYGAAFAGQSLFYGLAVYGALIHRRAQPPATSETEVAREAA